MEDKTYFKAMLVIAIILSIANILDALTTFVGLHLPYVYETNGYFNAFLIYFGNWAYIVKILLVTLILPIPYLPIYYLIKNIIKHDGLRFVFLVIYVWITMVFTYCWINNIFIIAKYLK